MLKNNDFFCFRQKWMSAVQTKTDYIGRGATWNNNKNNDDRGYFLLCVINARPRTSAARLTAKRERDRQKKNRRFIEEKTGKKRKRKPTTRELRTELRQINNADVSIFREEKTRQRWTELLPISHKSTRPGVPAYSAAYYGEFLIYFYFRSYFWIIYVLTLERDARFFFFLQIFLYLRGGVSYAHRQISRPSNNDGILLSRAGNSNQ